MQEMTITSVHALGPRYAVILKEKDADRHLPILVGASDANAIAIKLHNPQVSLNLTHDLLCTVIDALGGSVRQVLINRDCPDQKERCCLRSSTIGGRGPFCPPVTSGGQKTGCPNRNFTVWTTGEITWSAALDGPDCRIPGRGGNGSAR